MVFAVLGITGHVGGSTASTLLSRGFKVRAIVRDASRVGSDWTSRGVEVKVADIGNVEALTAAFEGVEGALVIIPPNFDPPKDFSSTYNLINNVTAALKAAKVPRIAAISTIGADLDKPNLLRPMMDFEKGLSELGVDVALIRPGSFLENYLESVSAVLSEKILYSSYAPVDRVVPYVATKDIGILAAGYLAGDSKGVEIIEISGEYNASPKDIAESFSRLTGTTVEAVEIPRDQWETRFTGYGLSNPTPIIQMTDYFNQGLITFKPQLNKHVRGQTHIDEVIGELLALRR